MLCVIFLCRRLARDPHHASRHFTSSEGRVFAPSRLSTPCKSVYWNCVLSWRISASTASAPYSITSTPRSHHHMLHPKPMQQTSRPSGAEVRLALLGAGSGRARSSCRPSRGSRATVDLLLLEAQLDVVLELVVGGVAVLRAVVEVDFFENRSYALCLGHAPSHPLGDTCSSPAG